MLAEVIDRLRDVRPTRLFMAIDGPRSDVPGEWEKVHASRAVVDRIDWPCEIATLFRDENLGCGKAVSSAVTWFFDHVESGIILEDDILPEPSFFGFCSELLDRYRHDPRVFAVSGCNFVPPASQSRPHDPYRFSQVPHIWGWATWRDRWQLYSLDIAGWQRKLPPLTLWKRAGRSLSGAAYWASTFELLARKKVDTWDGQLVFASMVSGGLTATSNVNLIENRGFGVDATHTHEDRGDLQPVGNARLPLAVVPVALDAQADGWTRVHHFRAHWRGILRQAQTYLTSYGRQ